MCRFAGSCEAAPWKLFGNPSVRRGVVLRARPGLEDGTLPFSRTSLMFVRFPRTAEYPSGAALEVRCVSRAAGAVAPLGRPDGALDSILGQDVRWFPIGEQSQPDGRDPFAAGPSRASTDSTATIAFVPRSHALGRCRVTASTIGILRSSAGPYGKRSRGLPDCERLNRRCQRGRLGVLYGNNELGSATPEVIAGNPAPAGRLDHHRRRCALRHGTLVGPDVRRPAGP